MKTVDECSKILEAAIGEVDHIIPSDVLEDTIYYLKQYKKLEVAKSWDDYPESMGR